MKSKFTLVELLVVISIIAILAAILLPALKKAKERVHSTACLGNQKQCMASFLMYADDNDFWLPLTKFNYASDARYWGEEFVVNLKYLNKESIFCEGYKKPVYTDFRESYGMRTKGWPDSMKSESHLLHLAKRISPSNFFVLGDSTGWENSSQSHCIYRNAFSSGGINDTGHADGDKYRIHFRHPGIRANAAFADGRAASTSRQEFMDFVDGWGPNTFDLNQY